MLKLLKYLALPLALFVLASKAFAAGIIWAVIGSVAFHVALLAGYWNNAAVHDVKASANAQPIRVIYILNKSTTEAQAAAAIPAASGFTAPAVSQQATRPVSGGTVTRTVAPSTFNGVTYAGGTLTGTLAQMLNSAQTLAQPPYRYVGSQSDSTGASSVLPAASLASIITTTTYGAYAPTIGLSGCLTASATACSRATLTPGTGTPGFYAKIQLNAKGGGYDVLYWPLDGATGGTCPAGYTPNATDLSKCDLTDATAARSDTNTLADGKCVVTAGVPNRFDPDCIGLLSTGALKTDTTTDGHPVTISQSPADVTAPVVAVQDVPGAGSTISQNTPLAGGGQQREDAPVAPDGGVATVAAANYPSTPPPQFPGQATGATGSPTATGTGTAGGTLCGAPGQPACSVTISNPSPGSTCGGPGQPACSVTVSNAGPGAPQCGGPGQPPCSVAINGDTGTSVTPEDVPFTPPVADSKATACTDCTTGATNMVSWYKSFLNVNLGVPNYSCTSAFSSLAPAGTVTVFQTTIDTNPGGMCAAMDSHEAMINNVFLLMWSLTALFLLVDPRGV